MTSAQQRRLAGAVRADDADAIALHEAQREIVDEAPAAEVEAHVEQLEDRPSEPRGARLEAAELDLAAHAQPLGGDRGLRALDARLLLRRARLRAAPEPLDLLAEEVLPVRLDALGVREALRLLLEEVLECADVSLRFVYSATRPSSRSKTRDRDLVEQVAIVRDEQHRARELVDEVLLEPRDGVGVEMVGRLVEDREVGLGDEDARERDAALLAAAHRADRTLDVVHAEVKRASRRPRDRATSHRAARRPRRATPARPSAHRRSRPRRCASRPRRSAPSRRARARGPRARSRAGVRVGSSSGSCGR